MPYLKPFLKKILHLIIIPFARRNNFLSFLVNIILFTFYGNYNIAAVRSNYLYEALKSNNSKALKRLLNLPFSALCEKLIFQYILYFRLFSEFRKIKGIFNQHSLHYLHTEFLVNYGDCQENTNQIMLESHQKISNFLMGAYGFNENRLVKRNPRENGKRRVLYVTGFFSQESLFKLFNAVAAHHDHHKFSFSIYCSASSQEKDWIRQYNALGYQFISKSDLHNANFDIVVDWDGIMASGHTLYEIKKKIAPVYLSFGNDFYPGGLHNHCIIFKSLCNTTDFPSEFYLPVEDACLVSFLSAHAINNPLINTAESLDMGSLKEYVGLPSLCSKISENDFEKISWFLNSFPQKKLAFIHPNYQGFPVKMFMEEKFHKYGIDKSRLTFFYDSSPQYLQRLKRMSFYFSTNPIPGGRTSLETIANGILSPFFERKNHIYSRYACLIPKVVGLDWLVSDNDADYQKVCRKLALLSEDEVQDIRLHIQSQINEHEKYNSDLFSRSFEKIFDALA